MTLQQLVWLFFSPSGRIGRRAYFLAGLLMFLLLFFPAYQTLLTPEDSGARAFWGTLSWFAGIAFLWSHVALGAKRLHDFGKSGLIALLIPLFVALAFIILCLIPGDEGANRYGSHSDAPR